MTYKEYRDAQQAEIDALPIFWAFGRQQFKQAMEERGLKETDTDKIYSFGGGGFYLRSDAQIIRDYFSKPDPLRELMKDKEFAVSAFYYEMANHEYHINNWQGDWDVCSCFTEKELEYEDGKNFIDCLHEAGYDDKVVGYFMDAQRQFLHDADEKGWY